MECSASPADAAGAAEAAAALCDALSSGKILLLFISDLWVAPINRTECRVFLLLAHFERRLLASFFFLVASSVFGEKSRKNCSKFSVRSTLYKKCTFLR